MRSTITVLCALFLVGITLSFAQNPPATLQGYVVDADTQEPLIGANIMLRLPETGLLRYGTATDEHGAFTIENITPGTYQVEASYLGYAPFQEVITLQPGQTLELHISLSAKALPQPTVVVTAFRAREKLNPITFSNLTYRDLQTRGTMRDLPVILSELPSITFYTENGNAMGYSYLRMRGFDQRRIAVLINGVPQNDPEDHNVYWINFFDLQGIIQDIQVQRGASSSLYGPFAIGGAINIVALPFRPTPYLKLQTGWGSFNTRRYTVEGNSGLLNNRYIVFARVSRLQSDGYREWSWTKFWRYAVGGVRYGPRSALSFIAFDGPQKDGLAYSGISKSDNEDEARRRFNFSKFTQDQEHFAEPHFQLLHDLKLTSNLSLHQVLFYRKGEGYFDFGGTFRSADYLRLPEDCPIIENGQCRQLSPEERKQPLYAVAPHVQVTFRAYLDQWQTGWMPRVTYNHLNGKTTLGAEARIHRSLHWGRVQRASGLPESVVGEEADYRVYSYRGEKIMGSFYAHHLHRLAPYIALQGDLALNYRRYRIFDEAFFGHAFSVPYLFVNPRLGVTLFPDEPASFYGSVAYSSREPRLKQLYDAEEAGAGAIPQFHQNPDGTFDYSRPLIKPEHLLDIELGFRQQTHRALLRLNTFWMEFWNEIVPSGGLDQYGVPRTGNADRTRHLGIEAELSLKPLRTIELYANATWSHNRFIRFTEYLTLNDTTLALVRDGNPIAGFPDLLANLRLTYQWHTFSATLHAQYASKQFVDNSGGKLPDETPSDELVVDPYVLVNAALRWQAPTTSLLNGLSLSLEINNLLNDKILLYGNPGWGSPQFFPAATRNFFASISYQID